MFYYDYEAMNEFKKKNLHKPIKNNKLKAYVSGSLTHFQPLETESTAHKHCKLKVM